MYIPGNKVVINYLWNQLFLGDVSVVITYKVTGFVRYGEIMLEIMVKRRKMVEKTILEYTTLEYHNCRQIWSDSYSLTDNLSDKISKMIDNKMLE